MALGGAPDDASSATAAADGVDHCLVGQWQPRAGAVEALQQKMLEAPDLFARVERSVRDTGTLCLDETGRVDEQVRLDPSTTRLVTRDGTDLTISGPLRADSKGWYHVRDGGIRFLGQARIEDRATRATVNGRDLGTGTAGLGLSIARGIVTAHGGTIGLADGPGGVVEIALPV